MKQERSTPVFLKPGDNPELDRLISELRIESEKTAEPVGHDLFGRPKEAGALPDKPAASRGRDRLQWGLLAILAVVAPLDAVPATSATARTVKPLASAAPKAPPRRNQIVEREQ